MFFSKTRVNTGLLRNFTEEFEKTSKRESRVFKLLLSVMQFHPHNRSVRQPFFLMAACHFLSIVLKKST